MYGEVRRRMEVSYESEGEVVGAWRTEGLEEGRVCGV